MREHVGNRRPDGGALSRFVHDGHGHADRSKAALKPGHAALYEARTIFPKSVTVPRPGEPVLISGHNNGKLGAVVTRGAWTGMPMFHLSLEERATCPRSCVQWDTCYGNAMPFAKRRAYGPELMKALQSNLARLNGEYPNGFVVRLHVLGDFPTIAYVEAWMHWLVKFRGLRIWGYTAHPTDSRIGLLIRNMNATSKGRCAIRFSVTPEAPAGLGEATVIWRQPEGPWVREGLVCPLQLGKTRTCGTCGLCWSPNAAHHRIVFVGHGMNPRLGPKGQTAPKEPVMPLAEPAEPVPPAAPALPTVTIRHEVSLSPETSAALLALAQAVADLVVAALKPPQKTPMMAAAQEKLAAAMRNAGEAPPTDPIEAAIDAELRKPRPEARAPAQSSWNGERDAVLRIRYPRGDGIESIRKELNTLPGAYLREKSWVYARANSLGLRRENSPDGVAPQPVQATWNRVLEYVVEHSLKEGMVGTKGGVLRAVNEHRKAAGVGVFVITGEMDWRPHDP